MNREAEGNDLGVLPGLRKLDVAARALPRLNRALDETQIVDQPERALPRLLGPQVLDF